MKKKTTQAEQLISLVASAELFHDPEGQCWTTFPVNRHKETWLIESRTFRLWLSGLFHRAHRKPPAAQALRDAVALMEAKARYEGCEQNVYVRVAGDGAAIYLDLCNPEWRAVEVRSDGWRVVANPPVRFRRARGMLPLPAPAAGGEIGELRQFLNVEAETDWVLLLASLVGMLWPTGPYPILVLQGEHGSAKSTAAKVIRSLVDPNSAAVRAEPRDNHDLIIAATNGWVVALDNLSFIPSGLSDSLCRLATGGGFGTRKLYTDGDEILFNAMRPVILNGIEELATRSDLLDRTVTLNLPEIPEYRRRREADFWAAFEQARPRILGALLDAVSAALRNLPTVKLDRLPRMADFATRATAAEAALGLPPESFLQAYTENRKSANDLALDSSSVAQALLKVELPFEGTCTALLRELNHIMADDMRSAGLSRGSRWPQTPHTLSNRLRRLAPNFRARGIKIQFSRDSGNRMVRIEQRG